MASTLRHDLEQLTQAERFAVLDAEFDRDPSQFMGPDKDPDEERFALYDAEWDRGQPARDAEYAEWERAQVQKS